MRRLAPGLVAMIRIMPTCSPIDAPTASRCWCTTESGSGCPHAGYTKAVLAGPTLTGRTEPGAVPVTHLKAWVDYLMEDFDDNRCGLPDQDEGRAELKPSVSLSVLEINPGRLQDRRTARRGPSLIDIKPQPFSGILQRNGGMLEHTPDNGCAHVSRTRHHRLGRCQRKVRRSVQRIRCCEP